MSYFSSTFILLFIFNTTTLFSQDAFTVHEDIRLPRNETLKKALLTDLDNFLKNADQLENSDFVDPLHLKKHGYYFEEFEFLKEDIEKSDTVPMIIQLINVYPIDVYSQMLELAILQDYDDAATSLYGIIQVVAKQHANNYKFYCPLNFNTRHWQTKQVGQINYHYAGPFDESIAKRFNEFNSDLARRLNIAPFQFDYYKCLNQQEGLKLMGFTYWKRSNGRNGGGIHSIEDNIWFTFLDSEEYKHDLVHVYFDMFEQDSMAYRNVEEGIACYLGGSWGDSFDKIVGLAKAYLEKNPKADLLQLTKDKFRLGKHRLSYVIDGIICQQLEQEIGFTKMLDLLYSGKKGETYYEVLEKLTGINEQNFNKKTKQLILDYELSEV